MIIGIDAGGTSTDAVLYDGANVLAHASEGAGNLKRLGYEGVASLVTELVTELTNSSPQRARGAVVGLAGATTVEERQRAQSLLAERLGIPVRVETDAAVALYGAFDGGAGMLLIAGTGSIAYGIGSKGGEPMRVGGWGWQIGDEGSGAWLGREAVRCVMLAYDGRGAETILTTRLLSRFKVATPPELVPIVYSPQWSPQRYGELSSMVLDAAVDDAVARQLVRLAAVHLARHLVILQERLGNAAAVKRVVLSGGLVECETPLLSELRIELDHLSSFDIVAPLFPPPVGAARMGL